MCYYVYLQFYLSYLFVYIMVSRAKKSSICYTCSIQHIYFFYILFFSHTFKACVWGRGKNAYAFLPRPQTLFYCIGKIDFFIHILVFITIFPYTTRLIYIDSCNNCEAILHMRTSKALLSLTSNFLISYSILLYLFVFVLLLLVHTLVRLLLL